ncbi:MAG: hypothetical protein MJZ76_09520 [Bacteroidales bacterium]|nr:hypothetical protein [Bacteroidales bacterium]
MENKDGEITLKTWEKIHAFLVHDSFVDGERVCGYNAKITIRDFSEWTAKDFHVYRLDGVDEDKLIDNEDMIKIASEKNLSEKNGVVEYIKPFLDDETVSPYGHIDRKKSVYKVKVSEIAEIKLEKYV